jgi:phospholipid transport system substrate-binding protein
MKVSRYVPLMVAVGILFHGEASAAVWKDFVQPWFKFKTGDGKPAENLSQTPTESIKDLDKKLSDYRTGDNLTLAEKEHNRALKNDILHTIFDVRELSRMALGRHWNERTPQEQDAFVNLMTDLLMERGILSKEQGKQKAKSNSVYNVSYRGDKYLDPRKTRALSKTSVHIKSENVNASLDYKLVLEGNQWKIYDVIVDGASLMENYKYQFDAIITKNGYGDLVARMQRKLTSFKAEGDTK